MVPFDLTGKTAVVCGLWNGVGEQTALALARHGAEVLVIDSAPDLAVPTVDAIVTAGGKASVFCDDATSVNGVATAFEKIADGHRHIDILVTMANRAHRGSLLETSADDLDTMIEANIRSVFHAMKKAVALMIESGGSIVNIASIFALVALKQRFAYMMTKGAVVSMTKSVAADYAEYNIRCNCVSASRIDTAFTRQWVRATYPDREEEALRELAEFHPLGRMGKPEEVSALILYLCSNEAAFVTGQDYVIDGGVTAVVPETIKASCDQSDRPPDFTQIKGDRTTGD